MKMLPQSSLIPNLERMNALLKNCRDTAQEINEHNLGSKSEFSKSGIAVETHRSFRDGFGEHFSSAKPCISDDRTADLSGGSERLRDREKKSLLENLRDDIQNGEFCCITEIPEQTIGDEKHLCAAQTKMDAPKSILKSKKNLADKPSASERKFTQYLRGKNRETLGEDSCATSVKSNSSKRVKFDLPNPGDDTSNNSTHLNDAYGTGPTPPPVESHDRAPGQQTSDGWFARDSSGRQGGQKFVDVQDCVSSTRRIEDQICAGECQCSLGDRASEPRENMVKEQKICGYEATGAVSSINGDENQTGEHGGLGSTDGHKSISFVETNSALKSPSKNGENIGSDFVSGNSMKQRKIARSAIDDDDAEESSRLQIRRTSASAVEHKSPNMETPIHFANIVEIIHRDTVKTSYEEDEDSEVNDLVFSESSHPHAVVGIPHSTGKIDNNETSDEMSMSKSSQSGASGEVLGLDHREGHTWSNEQNGSENEDTDSEEEDDGTMIVHDVEENDEDNTQPLTSNSNVGMRNTENREEISKNEPCSSDDSNLSLSSRHEIRVTSVQLENEKEDDQQTSTNSMIKNPINPLQTLDPSRFRAEKGAYSRMFLRQFKSNIYKKNKHLTSDKQQAEQVKEDTEKSQETSSVSAEVSRSQTSSPQPSPQPAQSRPPNAEPICTNADLMIKIDRISSLLDQYVLYNPSSNECLGVPRDNCRILADNRGFKTKFPRSRTVALRPRSKTCVYSVINVTAFLIALFLYILSVFALLRISFVKFDVSLQHRGVVPV